VLFLQLKSGTFYRKIFVFPSNNPTIAAEGPENSVPAMGCVAIKFLLLGCIATTLQIGALVDPTSNTIVSSPIKSSTWAKH
jgi:hypothetical protein